MRAHTDESYHPCFSLYLKARPRPRPSSHSSSSFVTNLQSHNPLLPLAPHRFLQLDRIGNNKPGGISLDWVIRWSLCACLQQFTRATIKSMAQLPDLKLLTPAQAANARALQNAMLWFSVAGAGPALLAMLLDGRGRIRRALACVGLASAVANHCVVTWTVGVTLVTAPNDDLLLLSVMSAVVFIFFAVVDVNASLVLLRPPGGEEEE